LYNGDLNGDGGRSNDLLYVPRFQSEMKFVALSASGSLPAMTADQQWAAFNAFIESDPYLRNKRGQYTERNGAETPWENQFDVRITQDIGGLVKGTKNRLQLTFDIINVGNLLNKEWGRQYAVSNQANTLVTYTTSSGGGFQFRPPANGLGYGVSGFGSAWSGQFGVRYLFN
jgi:hypothetical protein